MLDLLRGGDVALPHVPPQPPGPGQTRAGVNGGGRVGDLEPPARRAPVAQAGHEIGQQDVPGQPLPDVGERGLVGESRPRRCC